eukprot:76282-Chlamydomonas_euryale.AAC.2
MREERLGWGARAGYVWGLRLLTLCGGSACWRGMPRHIQGVVRWRCTKDAGFGRPCRESCLGSAVSRVLSQSTSDPVTITECVVSQSGLGPCLDAPTRSRIGYYQSPLTFCLGRWASGRFQGAAVWASTLRELQSGDV